MKDDLGEERLVNCLWEALCNLKGRVSGGFKEWLDIPDF